MHNAYYCTINYLRGYNYYSPFKPVPVGSIYDVEFRRGFAQSKRDHPMDGCFDLPTNYESDFFLLYPFSGLGT